MRTVRIAEVDVDTAAYDQGHVPGAVGWNWTTQLCDTLVRDVIPKKKLEELLGASGIDNDTTIVLYGDNNNWFAAWAFWQLKLYGHQDVRIMDGGRKKWLAEGKELSTDAPKPPKKTYKAKDPDHSLRAFLPEVQEAVEAEEGVARRRAQPGGIHGRDSRAARTSGNLPARRPHSGREEHAVGEAGERRRHVQERRRRSRRCTTASGVTGDKPVIAYCRIGERSSHTLVRAEVSARLQEREELRRLVDRMGQPRRRAGGEAVESRRVHRTATRRSTAGRSTS